MGIMLNGGVTIAPRESRRIAGRTYTAPVAGARKIATKEQITRLKQQVNGVAKPESSGGVIDVMKSLGPEGLWNVYVAGGAFGSKQATKTVFEEYFKAEDLPQSDLDKIWDTEEWEDWQPETTIPFIPSPQITPPTLPTLPSLEDLKVPLLIAGGAIAGLYILGKFIGRSKK